MVNTVVHHLKSRIESKCRLKVVCHPIHSTKEAQKQGIRIILTKKYSGSVKGKKTPLFVQHNL